MITFVSSWKFTFLSMAPCCIEVHQLSFFKTRNDTRHIIKLTPFSVKHAVWSQEVIDFLYKTCIELEWKAWNFTISNTICVVVSPTNHPSPIYFFSHENKDTITNLGRQDFPERFGDLTIRRSSSWRITQANSR